MKNNPRFFAAFRQNNSKVIREFITTIKPMVISLVRRKDTYQILHVDDILSETLAIVADKILSDKLKETNMSAALSSYAHRVAENICLNEIKKHQRSMRLYENGDLMENDWQQDDGDQPDVHIMALVKNVKSPCDEMLMDYYVHRLSYEEIAEKHGYKNYNSAKKKNGECLMKARRLAKTDAFFRSKFMNRA